MTLFKTWRLCCVDALRVCAVSYSVYAGLKIQRLKLNKYSSHTSCVTTCTMTTVTSSDTSKNQSSQTHWSRGHCLSTLITWQFGHVTDTNMMASFNESGSVLTRRQWRHGASKARRLSVRIRCCYSAPISDHSRSSTHCDVTRCRESAPCVRRVVLMSVNRLIYWHEACVWCWYHKK